MDCITGHLCLVSGQPTPNITPLLDRSMRPEFVVLLVTPDMEERTEWLASVIKPTGVKIRRWQLDDAWSVEHVQTRIMELLETKWGNGLALNATGGTKPMSIGAFSVFSEYDKPVFYVHPERDLVIWLHPNEWHSHSLEDRIKIPAFIQAHGYDVIADRRDLNSSRDLHALTVELIGGLPQFRVALSRLNWLAAEAAKSLHSPIIEPRQHDRFLDDLIQIFEAHGLCYLQEKCVVFRDLEALAFINGGWLEEHVYDCMRKLSGKRYLPQIQDLSKGVEVRSLHGGSHNELDVVFLADNRLHVIECKTRTWKEAGAGDEAIYKLDTLKDTLGGLQGRAMLVTFQELRKVDLARAENEGIAVCQGGQLKRLEEKLRSWIDD